MKNRFRIFIEQIRKVEIISAALLFGFLVALISAQVFVRYLFNKPFPWAEELAALLLIYLTYLTGDIVYKDKGHIAIDYFVNFLPERWKSGIALVIYLLIGIFLAVIVPKSVTLIRMQAGHTTAAVLPLAKSFWTLPVPVAFVSMLVTTVYFIWEEVSKLSDRKADRHGGR